MLVVSPVGKGRGGDAAAEAAASHTGSYCFLSTAGGDGDVTVGRAEDAGDDGEGDDASSLGPRASGGRKSFSSLAAESFPGASALLSEVDQAEGGRDGEQEHDGGGAGEFDGPRVSHSGASLASSTVWSEAFDADTSGSVSFLPLPSGPWAALLLPLRQQ